MNDSMGLSPGTCPVEAHRPDESEVRAALRHVIDPEIGLNLVDLGLIYSVQINDRAVNVVMTVTTPGCPMEHSLRFGVETAILALDGIETVQVEVVHDPPWNPSMMSEEGRAAAGIR
jgi:metal-sulfur cluster biosynthetic enzyme